MKRKFERVVNSAHLINNRSTLGWEKALRDTLRSAPQYIHRLGLETELVGHTGCVNTIEWSENGQ